MDADVIIVGAGPVGLLLANLLGSCGVSTLVIEREIKRRPGSRAIGVSPPSLQILRQIGLDEKFVQNGIKGVRVRFHGTRAYLGSIKIRSLPTPYPYLLALPQATTESFLEGNLGNYPVVTVMRGWKCPGVENLLDHVRVHLQNVVDNTDTTLTAKFAVGCDGAHSCVRKSIGIPFEGNWGKPTFVMGDYHDKTNFGRDAVLWFTKDGSVESFPLPGNTRRWIFQTSSFIKMPRKGYLEAGIKQRARVQLSIGDKIWQSSFGVQHFIARTYLKGRVFLCGDAAHTMSPIVGQGMNTGFADAEFLAFIIFHVLNNSSLNLQLFGRKYEYYRKIAAREAIRRAEIGMFIGTTKGKFLSAIRSLILGIAFRTRLPDKTLPLFTMLNIPFGTLQEVLARDQALKSLTFPQ